MFQNSAIDVVLLSFGVAAVSLTLTRSQLTKHLRERFMNAPFMLGELINCPYCMAHWIALVFAVFARAESFLHYLVVVCVLVGLSAVIMGVVMRLWYSQESELENLRDLIREAKEHMEQDNG